MFAPTAKLSKILANRPIVTYIYRDGVAIVENRTIKVKGGADTEIYVIHAIPCKNRIHCYDWNGGYTPSSAKFSRLALHNSAIIANGFDEITINLHNATTKTKEAGIIVNNVTFKRGYHEWTHTELCNLMSGDIEIQPNHYRHFNNENVEDSLYYLIEGHKNQTGSSIITYGEIEMPEAA